MCENLVRKTYGIDLMYGALSDNINADNYLNQRNVIECCPGLYHGILFLFVCQSNSQCNKSDKRKFSLTENPSFDSMLCGKFVHTLSFLEQNKNEHNERRHREKTKVK